jgi:hypothetical protein
MIIIAYIWIFFLGFSTVFFTGMLIIDKNINESSSFGKWWRNNMIGIEPKDDIIE